MTTPARVTELLDLSGNKVYPRPQRQDIMLGIELCTMEGLVPGVSFDNTILLAVNALLDAATTHGLELYGNHIVEDDIGITIVNAETAPSLFGNYVAYVGDVIIRLTPDAPDVISSPTVMERIFDDVMTEVPLAYAGFFGDSGEGIVTWYPPSVDD